jgi:integrase
LSGIVMKKVKPIIVKEGSVLVKIYPGKSRGYPFYTVAYYIGRVRKRETFADLEKARLRAHQVAVDTAKGRIPSLELTNSDRESYLRALSLLRPSGIPLSSAVEEFITARSLLDGESLVAAVKEHLQRRRNIPARSVSSIVDELLAAKQDDGLSRRYVYALRSDLTRFAEAFQTNVGSITSRLIEDWLVAQRVGARTRNNLRTSIGTLFRFARARGYLPKGQPTEVDDVRRAKDRGGKIGVLTPKQLVSLLKKAPAEIQLYLAIGAFTGIRTSEILRLEWDDVNFERGHIAIAADKGKTPTRRLVPIQPNLMQWLAPYRGSTGRVVMKDAERKTRAFAKEQGIVWPHNCLRHSYATYRLSIMPDAARVALEMGNSPQKLFTNYRELDRENHAPAWFAIEPKQSKKIIHFAAGSVN